MIRTRALPVLFVALALHALAGRHAEAQELIYGHAYALQNGINSFSGGFLDTDGTGCQGNQMCVSTATSTTRDGNSGSWVLLSAVGKKIGSPVEMGDLVYMLNIWNDWGGWGGWLDTRGTGCQGDDFCVSTATTNDRDFGSGTWQIQPADGVRQHYGEIGIGTQMHLKNVYGGSSNPGWLDVKNTGCQGNLYCVATSSNNYGANGSTTWRFVDVQTSVPTTVTSEIGINNAHPGYIVKNDTASLYWDVFGNLTLTNYAAYSPTEGGRSVSTTFGANLSPTGGPDNGPNPAGAILEFSPNYGALDIYNGSYVWKNWQGNAYPNRPGSVLGLDECTVYTASGSPSVRSWSDATPSCNRRTLSSPNIIGAPPECWLSSQVNRLTYDLDAQTELDFTGGQFYLVNLDTGNQTPLLPSAKTTAANVCLFSTGEFSMYDASGGLVWQTKPPTPSPVQWTVDRLAMSGWTMNGVPTEYVREEYPYFSWNYNSQHRRTNNWCSNVNRTIVQSASPLFVFLWHYYQLEDQYNNMHPANTLDMQYSTTGSTANQQDWFTCNEDTLPAACTATQLCFQDDGNLVLYDANANALWSSGTAGHPSAVMGYEGTDLTIVDSQLAGVCNCVLEGGTSCGTAIQVSSCNNPQNWVLWKNGNNMSSAGVVEQLSGGGFSLLKDDARSDGNFGAETWLFTAAADATSLTAMKTLATAVGPASAALNQSLPSPVAGDFMEAILDSGANVTLFGQTVTAVELTTYVQYNSGAASHSIGEIIAGLTVQNPNPVQSLTQTQIDLIDVTEEFFVGPIPCYVSMNVNGTVGYSGSLTAGTSAATIGLTPTASLNLGTQLAVGVQGASAGLQGSLTIEGHSLPTSFTINWSHHTYSYSAAYNLDMLNGEIDLFATLGSLSASKTLVSFQGISQSVNLFNMSGQPL